MRMSSVPSRNLPSTSRVSAAERKRLTMSTVTGRSPKRSRKVAEVLLGQDRGRHQHHHLLAGGRGLERRAHRDLGLAEAHVAADQAVHRARALHVVGHGVDGPLLVGGLPVREASFEFGNPLVVGRKRKAFDPLAGLVERDQLARHLAHRHPRARLHPVPGLAAELGQRRGRAVGAHVAGHPVELVVRDVEPVAVGERQREVVAGETGDGARLEAGEPPDAVVLVDHVVANPQIHEARQAPPDHRTALRGRSAATQDRRLGNDGQRERVGEHPLAHAERCEPNHAGLRQLARFEDHRGDALKAQRGALHIAAPRERHEHPVAVAGQPRELALRLRLTTRGKTGLNRVEDRLGRPGRRHQVEHAIRPVGPRPRPGR